MPVSSSSSRRAVAHGSSPLSIPPCGICQASSRLSIRRPTQTCLSRIEQHHADPAAVEMVVVHARFHRHCERSEAIQTDCHGAFGARNDGERGLKSSKTERFEGRIMATATHLLTEDEADAHPPLEAVVVRFAGDSGDGMQLTGGQFTLSTALAGNDLATFPDFPAEIRAPQGTTFGVSRLPDQFRLDRDRDRRRPARRADRDEPGGAEGERRRASRRRADHRRRGRVHRPQPRQGRLRRQPARGRQPRQMAAGPLQHLAADARRGEAVRPRQQGSAALQEHVDARPRAVDVRPRPRSRSSTGSRPSSPRRRSSPRPISPRSTPAMPMARRSRSARRSTSTISPRRRPSRASTAPSPAPKRWRSAWSRARSWPG